VCGPKEKHVQTLLEVVRGGASIADVTFLVKYLNRQIVDCAKWQTMLKTHILLHRLLHNSGDEFKDQLRRMQKWVEEDRATDSRIKCMFSIRNWRDDSNVDANELSQWTRSYAAYLEECVVNLDKIPRLDKLAAGSGIQGSQPTELRSCDEQTLMEKLPRIQNLMRRLLDCEAVNSNLTTNDAVISGISLLLKDSFKLYRLVNDGIIRLIDVFFTMTKLHAVKALDAYKRATQQGDDLERLFRSCNQWPSFRETKFPHIENPPASFMQTMEEYARTAPVESGEGGVGVSPGAAPPAPPAQQQQQAPVPQPAPVQTMPLEDLMGGFTAPAPQQTSPHTQQPAAPQVSPLNHFAAAGAQIAAANSLVDAFAAPAKHYSPPPAQQQPVAVAPPQPAAPAPVQPAGDIFGMEKPAMPMDLNALYDAPQPQANNPFGGATGGYGMAPTPGTGIGSFQAVPGQTPPHMMGGQGQMQQMGMGQQMPHMGTQMPQMQQQMGGMQQPQQQYGGMGMQQPQQMGQPAYGMPQMQQQPQMGQPQQQQQQQNNPFM
tara:strand:+ start:3943 stop:5574 length:1632 start_codon:yes stop_codon:yes gene_type:complete